MSQNYEAIINLSLGAIGIGLGWFFGRRAERNHLASLEQREAASLMQPVLSDSQGVDQLNVIQSKLAVGQVSICDDYFKYVLSILHGFLGGRLTTYESLLDRARREAILRMKESQSDASLFLNLRIETSTLDDGKTGQNKNIRAVQVLASSTAIWLADNSSVIG